LAPNSLWNCASCQADLRGCVIPARCIRAHISLPAAHWMKVQTASFFFDLA